MAIAYYKGNILVEPSITITEWDNKQLKFTDNPPGVSSINKMLYEIGLKERSDKDGFDDLGLGNYRSNESILNNIL